MRRRGRMRRSYADYGLDEGDVGRAIGYCRGSPDMGAVREAAEKANPFIADRLVESLVEGKGYDRLDKERHIVYGKTDFYAYRREAIYQLSRIL